MGSVTTICTDKTGMLTLNTLEVDKCYIGDEVIETDDYVTGIDTHVREALCNGISTPLLMLSNPHSSSAEDPLLSWAVNLGAEYEILRQNRTILETKELSTSEEGSGVLMRKSTTENEGDIIIRKSSQISMTATPSNVSESTCNLELPLIHGNST
ncbi:hypothetical protein M0R45_021032 [Rubus argutus]|uniref:Uncharacterized protein n=1 Tax=Rubus argutus TaxID=59490 RepID=A0AAW1XBG7_RUBAR